MIIRNHQSLTSLCTFLIASVLSTSALATTQSNSCDVRKLDLTSVQKTKMRLIRVQYKNTLINASNTNKNNNEQLVNILMQPNFEESQVRRYVFDRYADKMQKDINELKVQHAFLQVLNPKQKQDWINNCLH